MTVGPTFKNGVLIAITGVIAAQIISGAALAGPLATVVHEDYEVYIDGFAANSALIDFLGPVTLDYGASIAEQAEVSFAHASASARLSSTAGGTFNELVVSGAPAASASTTETLDPENHAFAESWSYYDLRFSITEPVRYRVQGSLLVNSSLSLANVNSKGPGEFYRSSPGEFDLEGELSSLGAVYLLRARAAANFRSQFGNNGSMESGYDFRLTLVPLSSTVDGDLNGDGIVGRADAALLAINFGMMADAAGADGDLNGDRTVGMADLAILQSNLTPIPPGAAGDAPAVPEPSTLAIALLSLMSWRCAARRSKLAR